MIETGPKPASATPWVALLSPRACELSTRVSSKPGDSHVAYMAEEGNCWTEHRDAEVIVHRVNGWDALVAELGQQRHACEHVGKERGRLRTERDNLVTILAEAREAHNEEHRDHMKALVELGRLRRVIFKQYQQAERGTMTADFATEGSYLYGKDGEHHK